MNPSADVEEKPHDTESAEALPENWRPRLHRYVCRYLDDAGAEDVVQESAIRLGKEKSPIRHPLAWLHRTARNLALNEIRRRRRTVPFDETVRADGVDPPARPDQQLEHLERVERLESLLSGLGGRERELLRLKFEEGASYKEMGERMKLSVSNVGFILCRTLRQLNAEVGKEGAPR
ncbi:MAG: RNA polymerase sigma factor [Puniceicoccaceae bacterium]